MLKTMTLLETSDQAFDLAKELSYERSHCG